MNDNTNINGIFRSNNIEEEFIPLFKNDSNKIFESWDREFKFYVVVFATILLVAIGYAVYFGMCFIPKLNDVGIINVCIKP